MKQLFCTFVLILFAIISSFGQKIWGGYLERKIPRSGNPPAYTHVFSGYFYTDGIGSSSFPTQLTFHVISKRNGSKLRSTRADKIQYSPYKESHPCDASKFKNVYLIEYTFAFPLDPTIFNETEGYIITHDPLNNSLDNSVVNISNPGTSVQLYHEIAAPTWGDVAQPAFQYVPEHSYKGYLYTCKDSLLSYQHYSTFYKTPPASFKYQIKHRFVTPTNSTGFFNWQSGFAADNPITASAPAKITDNPFGCLITVTPTQNGVYTLCFAVDYYVNNLKVGTAYHQMCVEVADCGNNPVPTIVVTNPVTKLPTPNSFCAGESARLVARTTNKSATFQWRLNGQNIASAKDSIYLATTAGSYTVVATDSTKCQPVKISAPVVLTVLPKPPANIVAPKTAFCPTESVTLTANTGTGYTYTWQLNGTTIAGATQQTFDAKQAGSYTVIVKDANCSATSTAVALTQLTPPLAAITAPKNVLCPQDSTVLSVMAGNGVSYQWQFNGANIAGATQMTLKVKQVGAYLVTVKDANGCQANSPTTNITQATLPTVNAGNDQTISIGSSITLPATTSGGATFTWQPALTLDRPNALNPVANPVTTTTYRITVASAAGCIASDEIIISVLLEPEVLIPSAFTPNDDGANDTWQLQGIEGYPNCLVEIYDRWGGQIFNSKGYLMPWDGKLNSQLMPVATYYYVIRLNGSTPDTASASLHGTVTIIK